MIPRQKAAAVLSFFFFFLGGGFFFFLPLSLIFLSGSGRRRLRCHTLAQPRVLQRLVRRQPLRRVLLQQSTQKRRAESGDRRQRHTVHEAVRPRRPTHRRRCYAVRTLRRRPGATAACSRCLCRHVHKTVQIHFRLVEGASIRVAGQSAGELVDGGGKQRGGATVIAPATVDVVVVVAVGLSLCRTFALGTTHAGCQCLGV